MYLLKRFLLLSIILSCLSCATLAQSRSSDNSSTLIPDLGGKAERTGSREEEMLHRAEIKRAEEAHQEMIERAKENAQLCSEIRDNYIKNQRLSLDDQKKLDRSEKLTRKIRSGSGGSDDDEPFQNPPKELSDSLNLLVELSTDLQKKVEKTSRLVTSAAVVKRSNEFLQLIQHLKTFTGR